jgi:fumarate reductase flavoprotein subunit
MPDPDFDVIVVGSGAAGLAAAVAAGQSGARVLVVESERRIGGSSRLSDAVLQAADTSVQRRDGTVDSTEAMFQYYMALNRWQLEPGLVRAFCDDARVVVEWLAGLGLEFGPVEFAGIEPTPRGHPTIGHGDALIAALQTECGKWKVDMAIDNRVEDVRRSNSTVWSVRARGEELTAPSVVLAAGGFAHNPALIQRYLGGRMLGGSHPPSPAGPGSVGDALVIGERLGAGITGHDRAHWVPGPLVPSEVVLVTTEGHRFINESLDHSVRVAAAHYHGHTQYAVFDERTRRVGGHHRFVARTESAFLFNRDPLRTAGTPVEDWTRSGALVRAATLREAALGAGLDSETVAATIEHYNEACRDGRDGAFEKDPSFLIPIETPPFYVLRVEPSMLVATFCGLRIDHGGRVLHTAGRPIRGLYAAGESAGGVVGEVYAGHGNSVTTGLVFGRRAGYDAAAIALGVTTDPSRRNSTGSTPAGALPS